MKTNNVSHAIADLNLEPIKNKLMDAEDGEGWSRAKADAIEVEYRRFLHLMHIFPNEAASPTKAVDAFWHYHILDTQKYAADCDEVFGCFLHHNPNGDAGSAVSGGSGGSGVSGGNRMQELYEATFGEAYIRAEVYHLDLAPGEVPGGSGTGIALAKGKSGAKAAVCFSRCGAMKSMKAKGNSEAKAAVCFSRCGAMSSMKAKGKSEAKAAVCFSRCGAMTGLEPQDTTDAKAAVCFSRCGAMTGMQPKNRMGASAQCA